MRTPRGDMAVVAVVFDMGGVLTVDPFDACRGYARKLGLPTDAFVEQLRGPAFAEVETGVRTVRDFLKFACRDVAERFDAEVDIRRLADCLAAGQRVRPEMVSLIVDLTDCGVPVGLLTNNAKEARSWWNSGVLPIDRFTAVVDSSDVGLRKPDPRIYTLTAERMGHRPDELLYFDDMAENVAGAQTAGLTGEVFTGPDECRLLCASHGLLAGRDA
ncbi:HAD family hydrolase [Mycolicibacterium holsaticum]|uniref:HAD family hydrolase n=1 Tax=Mycolicibacterium holsaticum TaxID=152142 RepID=UPI001C7D9742|nr:HAD family phosphatase [Mycolicibacterium holsaticum]MDA4108763.1 haloacid dehalogenase [Mycolicibacterium holsaticum DSM 44478 = JCM 12374]QZA12530.1 HAD family phosphatase [Mycolicibacterium holsaticum DSM 44478 = JCM 12374]UNC09990.1 HAD family phosphatase [Mycolicibacterium holsaticum DSM 44478 = JCM 12374]